MILQVMELQHQLYYAKRLATEGMKAVAAGLNPMDLKEVWTPQQMQSLKNFIRIQKQ